MTRFFRKIIFIFISIVIEIPDGHDIFFTANTSRKERNGDIRQKVSVTYHNNKCSDYEITRVQSVPTVDVQRQLSRVIISVFSQWGQSVFRRGYLLFTNSFKTNFHKKNLNV